MKKWTGSHYETRSFKEFIDRARRGRHIVVCLKREKRGFSQLWDKKKTPSSLSKIPNVVEFTDAVSDSVYIEKNRDIDRVDQLINLVVERIDQLEQELPGVTVVVITPGGKITSIESLRIIHYELFNQAKSLI